MPAEARFTAMGSQAHVLVVGGSPDLLTTAQRRVDDLEARWSRFRPSSELCRLNASSGHAVVVSPDLYLLVERSVAAWARTGGAFDPTVLDAVVASGYDRDFSHLPADRTGDRCSAERAPGCLGVLLDAGTRMVRLPPAVRLDPGGIGKGLAADLVTAELIDAGAEGALVNLGGDLRVRGHAPGGGDWAISIEHPHTTGELCRIELADGAVATSSRLRRRWLVGGRERNHVVEPTTGTSSPGPVVAATAVATDGWWAEAAATSALLGRPVDDAHVLTVDAWGAVTMPELLRRVAA